MVAAALKPKTPMDDNMSSHTPLALFSFPRTGKRGVPQQFPRRLYEMLDSETKSCRDISNDCPTIISWSASGKAFRIHDVTEFAEIILPKYFRTKKFSSFQRNLNLYGFAKVRRGADMDMYTHPYFMRDRPDALLQLQKITTKTSRYRCVSDASYESTPRSVSPPVLMSIVSSSSQATSTKEVVETGEMRPTIASTVVSSPPTKIVIHGFRNEWIAKTTSSVSSRSSPRHFGSSSPSRCSTINNRVVLPDIQSSSHCYRTFGNDRGKLDLLAMALERECFAL